MLKWLCGKEKMMWLSIEWWKYLLSPKNSKYVSWFEVIRCRANNHKCGVIWYNPTGLEPDMECKNCGDDLG